MDRVIIPVGYGNPQHRCIIDRVLMSYPSASIVDIRFSPRSGMPGWSGAALRRRYGAQYRWLGSLLGNRAYREPGKIEIVHLARGMAALQEVFEQGISPLLLLCACSNGDACHRKLVYQTLEKADPLVRICQPEDLLRRDGHDASRENQSEFSRCSRNGLAE